MLYPLSYGSLLCPSYASRHLDACRNLLTAEKMASIVAILP